MVRKKKEGGRKVGHEDRVRQGLRETHSKNKSQRERETDRKRLSLHGQIGKEINGRSALRHTRRERESATQS